MNLLHQAEIPNPPVGSQRRGLAADAFSILQSLADVIMPPVCLACHVPVGAHNSLCPNCWRDVDFIRAPLCDRLGLPLPFSTGPTMISAAAAADPPPYDRARAVARYDDVMRRLIHDLKFHDRHDPRVLFANWMLSAGADLIRAADIIVPVPLARFRLLKRRFNQSALLAHEVAHRSGLTCDPMALTRTRHTKPQSSLKGTQRRDNVRGAFAVPPNHRYAVADRHVLLIDDVITTGATIEACTRALLKANAKSVDVLAVALVTERGRVTM